MASWKEQRTTFRLVTDNGGRFPPGEEHVPSDNRMEVLSASPNAQHLLGMQQPRTVFGVLDGPGWIEGIRIRYLA